METLPLPFSPKKIYTVSELTQEIKGLLDEAFERVWVEGEISNLRVHSSGHLYFTLKDERSQLRGVMFRSQFRLLAFEPEDGMHVLCCGRLSVYEVRGEYQIVLDFMEPRGLGALQKAFEQLKQRLEKEGLFDAARKQALPFLPLNIGVVTSPTGAAVRDILQILDRRFPDLHIVVRPTRVQGEGAAAEIAEALDDLNGLPWLDLIILARGGGSLEDLWAFNEEIVARALARSRLPVISGVGHEVDFTIADFVADVRAPTPSAAAELAIPRRQDLLEQLQGCRDALLRTVRRNLQVNRESLTQCADRIQDPRKQLVDHRLLLDDLQGRMINLMQRSAANCGEILASQTKLLLRSELLGILPQERRGLRDLNGRLLRAFETWLSAQQKSLRQEALLLDSLSPLQVLKRGYSITRLLPAGEIVRDVRRLKPGERLEITFDRGHALCRVQKIELPDNKLQ
jgi:exodeoxyribonuclease VII large subunit